MAPIAHNNHNGGAKKQRLLGESFNIRLPKVLKARIVAKAERRSAEQDKRVYPVDSVIEWAETLPPADGERQPPKPGAHQKMRAVG